MDTELMNDAALRGTELNPFQLILRRYLPLNEFAYFSVDFAKFLCNFTAQFLVYLYDLQLDLGYFPAHLRARAMD
jgi:hypothetical protein